MTVADASVFIAYFRDPDPFHVQTVDWLQQHLLAGGVVVVPRIALAEVAGALARRTGDPAVGHGALDQMAAMPNLSVAPMTDELVDAAVTLAADLRLKGTDAVYVALAAQLRVPLATWDREQRERGGTRVDARQPDEMLKELRQIR